jgi:DNA-directed RNA polymerase specialized sigma24 family protein
MNYLKKKTTVREELEYWNVLFIFRRVKDYYRLKLRWMAPKDMQGLEADDFAMTVMMKLISEDVSWQRSSKNSFMDFVFGITRGEWSHFIRDNQNRMFYTYDDEIACEKSLQNIQLVDKYQGF